MSHSMSYWFWCELQRLPRHPFAKKTLRDAARKKNHRRAAWTKSRPLGGGAPQQPGGLAVRLKLVCRSSEVSAEFRWEQIVWNGAKGGNLSPPSPKGATAVLRNSFPLLVSHFFSSPADNFIFRRWFLRRPPWPLLAAPPLAGKAMRGQTKWEANYANAKPVRLTTSS